MPRGSEAMHISILGTDYKGVICAGCLAMRGHRVICVDRTGRSLEASYRVGYAEAPGLDVLIEQGIGMGLLSGTTDLCSAVRDTDLTFLCDGDEERCGTRMFGGLEAVSWLVGKALRDKDGPHALVLHSRERPDQILETVLPILERSSGKRARHDFQVEVDAHYLSADSAMQHIDRTFGAGSSSSSQASRRAGQDGSARGWMASVDGVNRKA